MTCIRSSCSFRFSTCIINNYKRNSIKLLLSINEFNCLRKTDEEILSLVKSSWSVSVIFTKFRSRTLPMIRPMCVFLIHFYYQSSRCVEIIAKRLNLLWTKKVTHFQMNQAERRRRQHFWHFQNQWYLQTSLKLHLIQCVTSFRRRKMWFYLDYLYELCASTDK